MNSLEMNSLEKDYQEFLNSDGANPRLDITNQIFSRIQAELSPSPYGVFSKLLLIHCITALITLSFCPQFGFQIGTYFGWNSLGLMHLFMGLGEYGCTIACGSFFTGISLLIASLLLRPEQVRVIRENKWIQLGSLTLLSAGFFVMVSTEFILNISLAWMVGSFFGSLVTLELGWRIQARGLSQG